MSLSWFFYCVCAMHLVMDFPIYLPCSRHGLASGTSLPSWFYWGILEASGCPNPGFSSAPASRWRLLQVFQPGYSSCITPVMTSSDFPLRFLDTSLPLVFRLSILVILLFSMCYVACLDYLRSQCFPSFSFFSVFMFSYLIVVLVLSKDAFLDAAS